MVKRTFTCHIHRAQKRKIPTEESSFSILEINSIDDDADDELVTTTDVTLSAVRLQLNNVNQQNNQRQRQDETEETKRETKYWSAYLARSTHILQHLFGFSFRQSRVSLTIRVSRENKFDGIVIGGGGDAYMLGRMGQYVIERDTNIGVLDFICDFLVLRVDVTAFLHSIFDSSTKANKTYALLSNRIKESCTGTPCTARHTYTQRTREWDIERERERWMKWWWRQVCRASTAYSIFRLSSIQ